LTCAWGKSTAVNSTPLSIRFEMKATLRASRSSFAMMRVAPWRRQRRRASASLGRSAALDLHDFGREVPVAAVQMGADRLPLGLQAEAAASAVVGDELTLGHVNPRTA
jgi:hypothetical protein